MFKIIGIETLPETGMMDFLEAVDSYAVPYTSWIKKEKQARFDCVNRVLKKNIYHKPYLLFNNYSINQRCKLRKKSIIDEGFFQVGSIKVSISAIVGKNGSGKSTLIDLMLRLMNNVAFALKDGIDNNYSYNLQFAECVYGRLYFENEDGDILTVEQIDHDIKIEKNDRVIFTFNNIVVQDDLPKWEITDTKWDDKNNNEKCVDTLKELFYTIIVNYSAYAYNIDDYETEWSDHDEFNSTHKYKLLTREQAKAQNQPEQKDYFKGRISDEEKCWIGALFHKNDAYQTPIVINPYRERGNVDYNREKRLLNERIYLLLIKNQKAVTALLNGKEPYKYVFVNEQQYLPLEGQSNYYYCKNVFDALNVLDAYRVNVDSGGSITYSSGEPDPSMIAAIIDKVASSIICSWERCMGFQLLNQDEKQNAELYSDRISAVNYIVYKTIKTTYNYSKYRSFQQNVITGNNLDELVMSLYCDTSHITLKLRRALAYLIFGEYGANYHYNGSMVNEKTVADYQKMVEMALMLQNSIISSLIKKRGIKNAFTKNDFKEYGLIPRTNWIEEELMPTPSLKVSLVLRENNRDDIYFDTLSSGEKQIIYTLGTTIYQLHHLNSADETKIQYKNVNIVFDEIELYFHPSYQKELVKRMLDMIGTLNLSVIKNINMIFATHSPFILSDIPQENILYIKDGVSCSENVKVNPLGANINDVLHQSFFLDNGFMGDNIKSKLELLIDILSNSESPKLLDKKWKDEAEKLILAIGDPFLRDQLLNMYMNKIYGHDTVSKKQWLMNVLNELG